jgi:hypothetical protein
MKNSAGSFQSQANRKRIPFRDTRAARLLLARRTGSAAAILSRLCPVLDGCGGLRLRGTREIAARHKGEHESREFHDAGW